MPSTATRCAFPANRAILLAVKPRGDDIAGELVRRDAACVWHPYAAMPAAVPPVPVVGAHGVALELADGREVVDGMASWWAAIHGYRNPVLDQALRDQLDSMAHVMFGGITHPAAISLAERLVEITPAGLDHVFFADSGSVAVEVAIKMARQYWLGRGRPGRHRLLTVRGGYHGDTFGAMSVCDPVNGMHSMFAEMMPEHLFAPVPSPKFGEDFTDRDIAALRSLLAEHTDVVAAIILEPIVQGAGGMRFYSAEYLRAVRQLCDRYEVLLIADEIATGFGRTGELFACDHGAVTPDIMCLGKALTGGYLTMAATLCTRGVSEAVSRAESGALMHGPTFMANALAAAVSLASVDLLVSEPWRENIARVSRRLEEGLRPLAASPRVADVRVLGAIGVVEMVDPVPMKAAQDTLLDHGVWLRPFGRLLYTLPPYVATDGDLDAITGAIGAVVGSLS
ncbi:MAG: adenosylmethionine--8-amino-7-oxononanoate transaminase [Deltaproteobacteria bacterium]|nr:adenosylmethionine--8-amino-7-oxononanoate transaminase [Deltaproteobacteria bacterium]